MTKKRLTFYRYGENMMLNKALQKEIDETNTINMAKIQTVGELKEVFDNPSGREVRFPRLHEITEEMINER